MTVLERRQRQVMQQAVHDGFYEHCDAVAREFLATQYRTVREFEASILRNVLADCLYSAVEDRFIEKIVTEAPREHRATARRVIDLARPHLVDLCATVHSRWQSEVA